MRDKYYAEDLLQRFSTKVLWHFTGYAKDDLQAFDILKKIINSKIILRSELEGEIIMADGGKRWSYPYSCTCDIPFKDLRIHTLRYGHYGIAFNKENAIKRGQFNPVLYIHKDSFLFKYQGDLLREIDKLIEPHEMLKEKMGEFLRILGAYIKRSDLTAPIVIDNAIVDKEQNNNFYYEREWRSASNWRISRSDIEAIMVPEKDLLELKQILEQNRFGDIPIIPYEMVDRL